MGTYEGQWEHDLKHGQGVYLWEDGDRYEGLWKNSKRHGNGNYQWANGN